MATMIEVLPKRGDVFWISLETDQAGNVVKSRAVVVVSNNAANEESDSIIVAPLTSKSDVVFPFEAKAIVQGTEGKVLLDQVRSIDKKFLHKKIGSVEAVCIPDIDRALRVALDIS